jgi:hypothetical protein
MTPAFVAKNDEFTDAIGASRRMSRPAAYSTGETSALGTLASLVGAVPGASVGGSRPVVSSGASGGAATTGSELVESEVDAVLVASSIAGGVDEAPVSDDGFAGSGFSEFVRSSDGFWGDASRELDAEELTDIGVLAAADWLNRAASWDLVMQTGLGSFAVSVMQRSSAVTWWKLPVVAWMTVA